MYFAESGFFPGLSTLVGIIAFHFRKYKLHCPLEKSVMRDA
jgi:hypothetical protein